MICESLHAGTGSLLCEFLSPLPTKRRCLWWRVENRCAHTLEWPLRRHTTGLPLCVRISQMNGLRRRDIAQSSYLSSNSKNGRTFIHVSLVAPEKQLCTPLYHFTNSNMPKPSKETGLQPCGRSIRKQK